LGELVVPEVYRISVTACSSSVTGPGAGAAFSVSMLALLRTYNGFHGYGLVDADKAVRP
jgi:hypothetical protein